MKKIPLFTSIILSLFFLTGCLGDLIGFSCFFMDDSDHCYQAAAVQKADPYGCEKIEGEGFTSSNPPRDKCYLMIAQNTGDYDACEHIKGGPMSYTREECIIAATLTNEDPDGCKKLTGSEYENCRQQISATVTTYTLTDITREVEDAKSFAGRHPDDKEAQKTLADLIAKQNSIFDIAPDSVKTQYFREGREKIMNDIGDDDVKSEIAKIFIDYRNKNPNVNLNDQLKKMEQIKDDQEYLKNLDEHANTLMDQMKESAIGFADNTFDDLYGKDVKKYQEEMKKRGMKYLEEQGGDSLKRGIQQLEWIKEKYDKASEQYKAINEKIEKLKKTYNEAAEVYKKIDDINKLVAEGKLDAGKAKVLHGAVFLGKGLEYATGYVPVFGSTISTISKETFEATVKFATKRAQRTTALDKCIEDPDNCDPDNISPY